MVTPHKKYAQLRFYRTHTPLCLAKPTVSHTIPHTPILPRPGRGVKVDNNLGEKERGPGREGLDPRLRGGKTRVDGRIREKSVEIDVDLL